MITDIQLKNAKPEGKDYTIKVDTGLTLLIKTTGGKLWRFRYSFASKRCMISLGKYPLVTMKHARTKQQEYLDLLNDGINPSTHKRTKKLQLKTEKTFKEVALEWFEKKQQGRNPRYRQLVLRRMEMYAFPIFGQLPIKPIEAPMLFNIIESIQDSGKIITGKRVNEISSMVFRYGVAKGYCSRDITQDYKGMLKTATSTHLPALTEPEEVGELLRDLRACNSKIVLRTAMLISPYIFVRPSELVNSKWEFINFDKSHWVIPAEFMKMNRDHLIPFPSQVKTLLEALFSVTGHCAYIFPHEKDYTKPMHSENVNKALRRIEDGKYIGRMVSHGFRGMASTILNENKFRGDVIEKQLAHQEKNKVRNAYNHAEYLEERTNMMQWYADYLDDLASSTL